MKCPSCTKEIKQGLKFCPHCGMRIIIEQPADEKQGKKKTFRPADSPGASAAKWKIFIMILVFLFGGYLLFAVYEAYSIQKNFKLCQYNRRTGNYFRGIGVCEKIVRKRPKKIAAWVELARCYRGTEDRDKTIKTITDALKWGQDAELYAIQGEQFYLDKKPSPAEKSLDKALSLNSDNTMANYYRGLVYRDAGEYKKAIGCLEKALKKSGRKQQLNINESLGDIYTQLGNTKKAVNSYISARELDMNVINVCKKLARAYISTGDLDKALQEITRCVEIAPEDRETKEQKSLIFAEKEKIDTIRYIVARRKMDESLQMLYSSLTSIIDRFNADPEAFVGEDNIELSEIQVEIEKLGEAYRKLAAPEAYFTMHTLTLRATTTMSDLCGYLGRFMKSGEEQHYKTLAEYMNELEKVMSQLVTIWKSEEKNADVLAALRETVSVISATSTVKPEIKPEADKTSKKTKAPSSARQKKKNGG